MSQSRIEKSLFRVALQLRSAEIGAARRFSTILDWNSRPQAPVQGLCAVLSEWLWVDGGTVVWRVGSIIRAQTAASAAAECAWGMGDGAAGPGTVTTVVAEAARASQASLEGVSEDDFDFDEDEDVKATEGADQPYSVPVPAGSCAISEHALTIRWSSGTEPLQAVELQLDDDRLVVALVEHRPALIDARAGAALARRGRAVTIALPDGANHTRVVDRYSGVVLPTEGPVDTGERLRPLIRRR